nr:hypothetical protein BaRGS_032638 [Batillaria attramentaria]
MTVGMPASNGSVNAEEAIAVSNEKQEAKEKQEDLDKMALTVRVRQQVKDGCRNCCSVRTLKKKLPIIQWLPKYRCREFQCDLIAGLTVGLTVIPQGLAYAVVAGLPPQYGLYSAFMGCFVYMFLGTSKDITLGPTAIMSLMVGTFAASTEPEIAITLALVLTLMTGLVQLIMGLLNLGILVNYISYPVINSFTSAAAVTIGAGQIKKLRTIKWAGEDDPETVVPLPKRVGRKLVWLCGTAANAIVVITAGALAAILVENARVNNYKIDATQELIAIGALILLSLQVLVPYCYYIPKSALAAVIIMAVIQMIDIRILRILWRINKWDLVIHIITFICSLTVGIETKYERSVVVVQPDHGLFFPAIEYLESKVLGFATTEEKPRAAIIDMSHISG